MVLPFPTGGNSRGETRIELTPELARDFLDHSLGNRRVRDEQVDKLARDILADKYFPSITAGLLFDTEGYFRNGHHTCFAVIEAGVSIEVRVGWGLTDEELQRLDTGTSRTYKDMMDVNPTLRGEPTSAFASMIPVIISWEKTGYGIDRGHYKPTSDEYYECLEQNHDLLIQAIDLAQRASQGHKKVYTPKPLRLHMYQLLTTLDEEQVDYLEDWVTALSSYSHAWTNQYVSQALVAEKGKKTLWGTRYEYQLGLLNEAWNHFIHGDGRPFRLSALEQKMNNKDFPAPEKPLRDHNRNQFTTNAILLPKKKKEKRKKE